MFATSTSRFTRGISLLELMLSLLVIAIILLSATRYFMVANENTRVANAAQMINAVVQASYKWVEGMPNFDGTINSPSISILELRTAGLLPENYVNPKFPYCALNPWKSNLCVRAAESAQKIQIFLQAIPVKSCTNLQEKLKSAAPDANCFIDMQSDKAIFTATF